MTAPPRTAEGEQPSLADGDWHRLHPLTPLFKGGLVLIVAAGVVFNSFRERLIYGFIDLFTPGEVDSGDFSSGDPVEWVLSNNLLLVALGALLAVLIVLLVAFWLVWRFQQFRVTDEHVELRKGIVFRSHRRAPLDRVQGVNLTRPFPARLIGMAKLEVVGAGTDANVPLEYLSTARAESVRSDLLRLASGARAERAERSAAAAGAAGGGPLRRQLVGSVSAGVSGLIEGVDLDDVVPESVVKIPTGRLVGSQLLSGLIWFVFFGVLFAALMAVVTPILLREAGPASWLAVLGLGLGAGVPLVIAAVAITTTQITRSLRYSIAPTRDGIRITYGLFTTVTETIPPGRIFAVEVSQSPLWRKFGWWSVKINRMNGKSISQQQSGSTQQFSIALPVGTREDVQRVIGLILPDLPADEQQALWEHGILGPRPEDPYERMQARARWRRPVSWKRHGFALTEFALLIRRGVLWRKLALFPLIRLQGISASQGPIDRLQRVGKLKAHSVLGPVLGEVGGIERDAVVRALDAVARGASEAARREGDSPELEAAPASGEVLDGA